MIHQGSGGFRGNAPDAVIQMKEWEFLVQRNNEILARHTGQPIEKVVKDTDRDYFMAPEDAKDYGIIDAVYSVQWDSLTAQHHDEKVAEGGAEEPAPRTGGRAEAVTRANRTRIKGADGHVTSTSSTQGTQGSVPVFLLRQEPGTGPQAHRGPGRLHLRRVHQPLPGDHRGGAARDAAPEADGVQAPQPAPDQGRARPVRHQPGARQEGPGGRRLQPLQAGQRRPPGR